MTGPAGLPLGYDHTDTGAVHAATNYLTWMTSLRIKDKTTADAMAEATAADEKTRNVMVDSFDELRTGLDDVSMSQVDPARGAYAVAQYDDTKAAIYVWAPDVVVDSVESNTFWSTSEVLLVWRDGDWKLDGGLVNRVGGAAVYPADPEGNPSAAEKLSILSRTPADPGEITDTAEQEWLEYSNAVR